MRYTSRGGFKPSYSFTGTPKHNQDDLNMPKHTKAKAKPKAKAKIKTNTGPMRFKKKTAPKATKK